jgi:Flp pilus assembly CpaE family ATPase
MLRSIIICPDQALCTELHKAVAETMLTSVVRLLQAYPPEVELARILRAHVPQIVFLSIESLDLCASTAAHIEKILPGCQVIAAGGTSEPETLMTVMRSGIREFVAYPFNRHCVWESIKHAEQILVKRPIVTQSTDLVYSFLPAKPGVGTTTLALNGSLHAATDGGVLLTDFDLNCGMLRFLLKLDASNSIIEALEHAGGMDEQLWPQLVNKVQGIDVLHAGCIKPEIRIQGLQVQQLLEFARRNYRVVCADLSGNLERYSLEVMHESKQIFLVCTPEVAVLHLAREKMHFLQSLDLSARVSILLTRYNGKKSELKPEQVEEIVGAPVQMTFVNDYARVSEAIREGKVIDANSELGKQCRALGDHMVNRKAAPVEKRRRFVEYFALAPARFSFEDRR